MLNAIFHHMGMSWIISYKKKMKYRIDESNHPDLLKKGHWYNTDICSNYHKNCLKILLHMQEETDIISCVLLLHRIKNNLNTKIKKSVLGISQYLKTQQ